MIELPAPCVERDAAEGLFVDALKQSSAPDAGWTMRVAVKRDRANSPTLRAHSELADPNGAVVASRDFSVRGDSCAPLARAVGVWASLVLDQQEAEAPAAKPETPPPAGSVEKGVEKRVPSSTRQDGAQLETSPVWPHPQHAEGPYPEQALFLRHPAEARTLELGLSTFLMNAGDSGALAGGSVFLVAELPAGVFLRPRLSYGRNFRPLQSVNEESRDLGTARLDACLRMPGFYLDRRGLAVDICGGAEGGFLNVSATDRREAHTLAYGAFGPGIALRGEFANDFVAEVRAEGLMRIAEGLPVGGRAEMAIVWRAR